MISFYNALGKRKAQSPSPFFGSITWLENGPEPRFGNPLARILHINDNTVLYLYGMQDDPAFFLDGIGSII